MTFKISFFAIVATFLAAFNVFQAADQEPQSSVSTSRFDLVGDGKTDDTEALQQAVDSGMGQIRLPKGTYRLTQPIVIDLDKVGYTSFYGQGVATLLMDGPGPALRFVGTHFKSANPNGFTDAIWDRQRMPIVEGLGIIGNHPEADGIEAEGTMQLTIRTTHIRHVRHGIHLVNNNRNVIIADCHIYENFGVGVYYDDVNLHQSNITNCHISYNREGGVVSRAENVRNLHISGCDLESNMHPETEPTANVLIDCRGGTAGTAEVAITGCTIQHNNHSPDSANIRMIGRSRPINDELVREGNLTITGNVISDVQVNVHLVDCRGVSIVGNTFWRGFRHNLLIENSSNIVVGPNNFDRNPRYGVRGNEAQPTNSLLISNSNDCTLSGLHINNVLDSPAALTVRDCSRINLHGCTILDSDNVGLLLENVRDSRVSDCLIRDDLLEESKMTPIKLINSPTVELD